jgi:hypothetical protein
MNRRAALVLVAAGFVVMAPAAPAAAATGVSGVGSNYWWEAEPSSGGVPAPPSVPAGDLWISSDPAGAQSVSAVRFTTEAGASHPVLSLVIDSAQPSASSLAGQVEACPTTSAWTPGPGPSPGSSEPSSNCQAASVVGAVSQDGATLSFDLSKLASGLTVDVVLQPVAGSLGNPTFNATFQPVTASNVAVTPPPTAPVAFAPPVEAPLPAASAPPAAAPAALPSTPPSLSAPDTTGAAPVTVSSPAPALAGTGPASSSPGAAAAAAGAGPSLPASPAAIRIPVRSWRDRLLLGLAIVDIAGYAWWTREAGGGRLGRVGRVGRVGKPPPLR